MWRVPQKLASVTTIRNIVETKALRLGIVGHDLLCPSEHLVEICLWLIWIGVEGNILYCLSESIAVHLMVISVCLKTHSLFSCDWRLALARAHLIVATSKLRK